MDALANVNLPPSFRPLAFGACIAVAVAACGGKSTPSGTSDCPGFSKIVSGGFSRTGNRLVWSFELGSMAAEFVLNRAAVPDNMVEYGWQINVDADNDGQYECYLSIVHFKAPGSTEVRTNDILGSTEHRIWKISGDTLKAIGAFEAGLKGKVFTFTVDDTSVTDFRTVTSASQSSWALAYRYGGIDDVCTDEWP